jgi:SAM-dependent methyltransferase
MSDLLEAIGACPRCRARLVRSDQRYLCTACGRATPIIRGVPRFVSDEHYAGNFGFEWRRHRRLQVDSWRRAESERTFAEKTGLTPEDVKGKLVLDAGVGTGRFSDVVARWGGTPVGVDLSLAVESARRNLAPYAGARVVQGDIFELPFQEASFDIVFSIGVLHHTRSTREAFRSIARLLKPGGVAAIAVYEASPTWEYSDRYRRWTTNMSYSLLHFLSHAGVWNHHLIELARALPHGEFLAGNLFRALPTRIHEDPYWRILDTFDWFSPHFQWKHDEHEVKRWFSELGFEGVTRLPERTMVSVRGVRPTAGPLLDPKPSEERRQGEPTPLPAWIPSAPTLRDAALLALLAGDIARGYLEVGASVVAEAKRKLLLRQA